MSIRNKLISAFAVLSLLLLSLAIMTNLYLEHSRSAQQETVADGELRYTLKNLQYRLAGMSNDERAYIMMQDSQYTSEITAKGLEVTAIIDRLKSDSTLSDADKSSVDQIEELYADYTKESQKAIDLVLAGQLTEAKLVHFDEERAARKKLDQVTAEAVDRLNAEIASDNKIQKSNDKKEQTLMYGFFIAGVLLSIVVAFLIIRAITKPLAAMNGQMREIADGKGDLSREIIVRSRDEIGTLADSFNRMLRNLRGIMSQAQDTAIQVAASSEELTASAEQTTRATEQIVEATNQIADSSTTEQNHVAEAVTAIQQISNGIYEVSASNDEVSRLAQAASEASAEGTKSVREVLTDMQVLDETVQQAAVVIQSLGNRSQEIQGIAIMITDLAYRTNLLSLNAGIEAARAGEHGRGFAVVALEIRKLAEESRKSAEQIGSLIEDIVTDTGYAVGAMNAGTAKVTQSLTKADTVDRALTVIEEHVNAVTARVDHTAATTQELAASSKQIVSLMEDIADAGNEVTAACQNNSASTEEQLATMEEISSSSQALSKLAEDLNNVLSRFKLH
ncbi:methyl-accepting chemotaxis protein [Cohnella yongneupensis]|uniref:Methyl-accepting chemotaxis protein n=1 Tax=Cohnella yongneupensis TaxID=425006 RepID=A0ABW0R2Z6_9BACL